MLELLELLKLYVRTIRTVSSNLVKIATKTSTIIIDSITMIQLKIFSRLYSPFELDQSV